jgi:predicted nucleic acid-binding protein
MAGETIRTGLDTGFFVMHNRRHPLAQTVWSAVGHGERLAVVSAISLYEIHCLGLKGMITPTYAKQCLESISQACDVVWVDRLELLKKSAQIGHGLGLSLADSIVLSAFLSRGCREIYTTDTDLETYRGKSVQVINLN